jgi:WD40 repeat protein
MSRRWLCTGILVLFAVPHARTFFPSQLKREFPTDHYGDSLPRGAVARLGTLRMRHAGTIAAAALSPDQSLIAAIGQGEDHVTLWQIETGAPFRVFHDVGREVGDLRFSKDGKLLAVGSMADIMVFEIASGKRVALLKGQQGAVMALTFADGGKTLVSVSRDATICWWDVVAGKQTRIWDPAAPWRTKERGVGAFDPIFIGVALAPNGDRLAAEVSLNFTKEGQPMENRYVTTLLVWDLAKGQELWRVNALDACRGRICQVFSTDGKLLATNLGTAMVYGLDAATGKQVFALDDSQKTVRGIALAPDGKKVVAVHEGLQMLIWDTASAKVVCKTQWWALGDAKYLELESTHPIISADGKTVVTTVQRQIRLWNAASLQEKGPLTGHRYPVDWLHFTPDGHFLYSGKGHSYRGGSALIQWRTATWKPVGPVSDVHAENVKADARSSDQRLLLAPDAANHVALFDNTTGKLMRHLTPLQGQGQVTVILFTPDNRMAGIVRQGIAATLDLFDVATGKFKMQLDLAGYDNALAISGDSKQVAYFRKDGRIGLTAIGPDEIPKLLRATDTVPPYSGCDNLVFSPCGRWLASWHSADGIIRVWNVASGKLRFQILGGEKPRPYLESFARPLAFSPDGQMLAASNIAGTDDVQVWEVATGKLRRQFQGHGQTVTALAFSPHGRWLASGSKDTTILVWDLWGPAMEQGPGNKP